MIQISHLEKYYGSKNNVTKALNGISFEVVDGEFISIMGPSGSGKTTLLNCVSSVDVPSAGHVFIDGMDITCMREDELATFRREKLGFIFQEFNLLDTLTVQENIAMPLVIRHFDSSRIENEVARVAAELEIQDTLSKYPYQISGGQRQRCACARAVVCGQKIIMADEPTGSLDSRAAYNLLLLIKSINEQHNSTVLMVTHDATSASFSDRVLFLRDGMLYSEIRCGAKTQEVFFREILDMLALMGVGASNAC